MWPRSRESSITFNCLNLTFNTSNDNCMSSNLCNESKTSASDCNQQSIREQYKGVQILLKLLENEIINQSWKQSGKLIKQRMTQSIIREQKRHEILIKQLWSEWNNQERKKEHNLTNVISKTFKHYEQSIKAGWTFKISQKLLSVPMKRMKQSIK